MASPALLLGKTLGLPGTGVPYLIHTKGAGFWCGKGPVTVFSPSHLGRQPGCLLTHQMSLRSGEGQHMNHTGLWLLVCPALGYVTGCAVMCRHRPPLLSSP